MQVKIDDDVWQPYYFILEPDDTGMGTVVNIPPNKLRSIKETVKEFGKVQDYLEKLVRKES
jgi:hypothetical protein